jgi:hypothetical protein
MPAQSMEWKGVSWCIESGSSSLWWQCAGLSARPLGARDSHVVGLMDQHLCSCTAPCPHHIVPRCCHICQSSDSHWLCQFLMLDLHGHASNMLQSHCNLAEASRLRWGHLGLLRQDATTPGSLHGREDHGYRRPAPRQSRNLHCRLLFAIASSVHHCIHCWSIGRRQFCPGPRSIHVDHTNF